MSWLLAADPEPVVRLTPQARIIGAILAIAFLALILDLIRRDKLLERYSIVWFLLGIGMLLGAIFPVALEWLAKAMGVRDVTIALFSVTLLILLALSLNFSVIASRQSKQITRLAQQQAIDGVEEEAGADSASPAGPSRAGTPGTPGRAPR